MSDMIPPLIASDAEVHLLGPDCERTVKLASLYKPSSFAALTKKGEILTKIMIPKKSVEHRECYERMAARKTIDYPAANAGIALDLDANQKTCLSARVVIGSVAPGPFVCEKTEKLLEGKELDTALIESAAETAENEIAQYAAESLEFPTWYRLEMVRKMVRDILTAFKADEYTMEFTNPPLAENEKGA